MSVNWKARREKRREATPRSVVELGEVTKRFEQLKGMAIEEQRPVFATEEQRERLHERQREEHLCSTCRHRRRYHKQWPATACRFTGCDCHAFDRKSLL